MMFTAPRPTNEAEALYVREMAFNYSNAAEKALLAGESFFGLSGAELKASIEAAANHEDRAQSIIDGYEDLRRPVISQEEWERQMWELEDAEWAALELAQASAA